MLKARAVLLKGNYYYEVEVDTLEEEWGEVLDELSNY